MKVIRAETLPFEPASHEDPANPGVLKKILLQRDAIPQGIIQMINWAKLPVQHSFRPHYHEDMDEIFILVAGEAILTCDQETVRLTAGDAVVIPAQSVHEMKNDGSEDVEYIVAGISRGTNGQTIVVAEEH